MVIFTFSLPCGGRLLSQILFGTIVATHPYALQAATSVTTKPACPNDKDLYMQPKSYSISLGAGRICLSKRSRAPAERQPLLPLERLPGNDNITT
jgi:hypothetical protein